MDKTKELNQVLDVINKVKVNVRELEKQINRDTIILLLVGDTGSGKSTIFNLLCGAQFQIAKKSDENGLFELGIKKGTKIFSEIQSGSKSITTQPLYYFNQENNHLIIDFPGFRDTRGEIQEMIIWLIFNKIVQMNKVKLVYVIQQALVELQNRGVFLQQFFKIFNCQIDINFSDCFLVLNQFTEKKMKEEVLINCVRQQLFQITGNPQQYQQNMFVFRYMEEECQLMDFQQKKLEFWTQLEQQKIVQLSSFKISKLKVIKNFIKKQCSLQTKKISEILQNQTNELIKNESIQDLKQFKIMLKGYQFDQQSIVTNYNQLIALQDELKKFTSTEILQTSNNVINFLEVLVFFEGYKEQIEDFQEINESFENINQKIKFCLEELEEYESQSKLENEIQTILEMGILQNRKQEIILPAMKFLNRFPYSLLRPDYSSIVSKLSTNLEVN